MKKLMIIGMALCCVMASTLMTGCSKSPRERFEEAITELEPNKDKVKEGLEFFDKQDSEKQLELADRLEYMVLLKQSSKGMLKGEALKTAAGEAMEEKSPKERKGLLEKTRKAIKESK